MIDNAISGKILMCCARLRNRCMPTETRVSPRTTSPRSSVEVEPEYCAQFRAAKRERNPHGGGRIVEEPQLSSPPIKYSINPSPYFGKPKNTHYEPIHYKTTVL